MSAFMTPAGNVCLTMTKEKADAMIRAIESANHLDKQLLYAELKWLKDPWTVEKKARETAERIAAKKGKKVKHKKN